MDKKLTQRCDQIFAALHAGDFDGDVQKHLDALIADGLNRETFGQNVKLDGDRLVVAMPQALETIKIYERNAGGPDQWGKIGGIDFAPIDGDSVIDMEGDYVVTAIGGFDLVQIYKRGGPASSTWNWLADLTEPVPEPFSFFGSRGFRPRRTGRQRI